PPNTAQLDYASKFFHKHAPNFLASFPSFRFFPKSDTPEIALLGMSNVGKSSLANAVFRGYQREVLARTSKIPGHTKEMVAFMIGPQIVNVKNSEWKDGKKVEWVGPSRWCGKGGLVVVDMPGYGARSQEEWGRQIMKYLSVRKQLRRAFLLVDITRGLKPNDRDVLNMMRESGVPHQIILTKADKLLFPSGTTSKTDASFLTKGMQTVKDRQQEIYDEITMERKGNTVLADILTVSAGSGRKHTHVQKMGIDSLRWAIMQCAGLE
ncbi:P-loop containing nucleoside triphosphate hydrolase protein, partial [Rhizodiscina lignyota]